MSVSNIKVQYLEIKEGQEKLIQKLDLILRQLSPDEKQKNVLWTETEHAKFLELVNKFGKNKLSEIAKNIPSKNVQQVASHAQKFFLRLGGWVRKNVDMSRANASEQISQYLTQHGLKGEGLKQVIVSFSDY
ncbi:Myb-like_DNA-binding domain-containing protein [Hexamita inflata]|uniref:Myb-like DNA-binding domain-containing protein n=1 Tax=Hexamita inflata TaxID=28002 RepID=A0AA86VF75_9EUKA|nr:Myb-like DNA-binding domain-containing protein [Hexamita inflata]